MNQTKAWISAFRLRTLPLALSVIFMGTFLAAEAEQFDGLIFGLAVLTTLFLQILSNLANDYGDSIHGADSSDRKGPSRAVQTGAISSGAMLKAIYFFSTYALLSGLALIYFGLKDLEWSYNLLFLFLGIGAIAAAIKYTAGKNPYGYRGLGDIFVFLFFGPVGVVGSYFLMSKTFDWTILLPASSMGLLSVGVLNVNNMRDHISDKKAGKISLVVKMGFENAKTYHTALITLAFMSMALFVQINQLPLQAFCFLVTLPLFLRHLRFVWDVKEPEKLDKQLKVLALSTLLFCLSAGFGLLV